MIRLQATTPIPGAPSTPEKNIFVVGFCQIICLTSFIITDYADSAM